LRRDCGAIALESDISGKVLSGGTKTVEQDPLPGWLLLLSIEGIVRIEPMGERVTEAESGTRIGG
jgi:hypothetical protein